MKQEKARFYINYILLFINILLYILITFFIDIDFGSGYKELENIILLALPCFIFLVTSFNLKKEERKQMIFVYLACYFIITLGFVFSNNRSSILINEGIIHKEFNLIPFKSIIELLKSRFGLSFALYNIVGNFLMLTPLSILLPLISDKYKKIKRFLCMVLIISLSIEAIQVLIKLGSFDIDDVILNVGGAVIIFLLFNKTRLFKIVNKLFYEIDIKSNVRSIIYLLLVIISSFFIITRIISIVVYFKDNIVDYSHLACIKDNKTYIGRKDNYEYYSECDYGNSYIRVGNQNYRINDFIQTKKFDDALNDKLKLTKKEIITKAYFDGKINSNALLYRESYSTIYLYRYEKLMVEIDNEIFDFKELLNSSKEYDMSYLHGLTSLSTIDLTDNYIVEKGKYYNIITCGDIYETHSDVFIIDKSIKDYNKVCNQ